MYEDKNLKDNYTRDYNINHSDNSGNSSISEKESVCISTVEDEYVLKKHPIYKYSKNKNEDVEDAEIITFWKRLKPILFLVFIVCLVFVQIEGNPKYDARKGKWWSITKARKMFFIGRYRDAYFCYIHSKGPLSSKDLDYQKVANIMKENFTKKKFRIFFRTPNLPIISNGKNGNDENDTLSDDIKNEIYSIAENYKNEEYVVANKNMSKYEEAALCYKVCGDDFKDSKEKSKKCLIDYVQYCKNKGDFVKAEEIINRLEQNEITKNLLQNVYETSYKTAKENYNKCFYKIAKEQFSYLAKRNFKDSEEMSRLCEQLLRYRLAITIDNGFNFDTLNYSYFKEYTNAIDYMVYYFKKSFGLTDLNEIFESARNFFKEFGEKAFADKQYYMAYEFLSLALKYEGYNPKLLEYAKKASELPEKERDLFVFGRYEQDGNLENGPEPIEWIVLARDNNKVLLLSKHVLDYGKIHTSKNFGIGWNNCKMRSWLNKSFYNKAFNEEERKQMLKIEVSEERGYNRSIQIKKVADPKKEEKYENTTEYKSKNESSVYDFVSLPSEGDLYNLDYNYSLSAYAVPAINKKIFEETMFELDGYYTKYRKNWLISNLSKPNSIVISTSRSKKEAPKIVNKTAESFYLPFGYWLRETWSFTNDSNYESIMRYIDDYGYSLQDHFSSQYGIRPEIMLRLN